MTAPQPSRLALVTGGSGGLGRAICLKLAERGHRVVVHYHSRAHAAEEVCEQIRSQGGQAQSLGFDVCDRQQAENALQELTLEQPVSILVNNAGTSADAPFPALSGEAWDQVLSTTLDGFYNVTRPLVMGMVAQKYGRIISISSIAATLGNRGQVNYAAAKAGLIGASKSLALELAKRKITVNVVAPGLIETEMLHGLKLDELKKTIPVQRLGRPEEVAAVVDFFASEAASYVTGQVLTVSGGLG